MCLVSHIDSNWSYQVNVANNHHLKPEVVKGSNFFYSNKCAIADLNKCSGKSIVSNFPLKLKHKLLNLLKMKDLLKDICLKSD